MRVTVEGHESVRANGAGAGGAMMVAATRLAPAEPPRDLAGVLALVWNERRRILAVAFASAIVCAGISLTLRPVFKASALLAPASSSGEGAGLAGIMGQLAGLGSIAGVDIGAQLGGKTSLDETLAYLSSRDFTLRLIRETHAEPVLFYERWDSTQQRWKSAGELGFWYRLKDAIGRASRAVTGDQPGAGAAAAPDGGPSDWDLFERFDEIRTVVRDKKTSLVTVTISWRDPEVAAAWTNELVRMVNNRLREHALRDSKRNVDYLTQRLETTHEAEMTTTIYRLLERELKTDMAVNLREEFALQVIDPAVAPRTRSSPHRTAMTIAGFLLGGFLGLLWVLQRSHGGHPARPD
jgi:uncharacterized protein involved in exopolysaccharide biosynthesis